MTGGFWSHLLTSTSLRVWCSGVTTYRATDANLLNIDTAHRCFHSPWRSRSSISSHQLRGPPNLSLGKCAKFWSSAWSRLMISGPFHWGSFLCYRSNKRQILAHMSVPPNLRDTWISKDLHRHRLCLGCVVRHGFSSCDLLVYPSRILVESSRERVLLSPLQPILSDKGNSGHCSRRGDLVTPNQNCYELANASPH